MTWLNRILSFPRSTWLVPAFVVLFAAGIACGQADDPAEVSPFPSLEPVGDSSTAGTTLISGLRFDPALPETGSRLRAFFKMQSAVRAEVRWSVNGEETELVDYDGIKGHVEFSGPIKAGDKIEVSITPFDVSGAPGQTVNKSIVCGNAPPTLKLARQEIVGDLYNAKIDVSDPENDPVTLTVEGPPGMRIDQRGNLTWRIDASTRGSFTIVVTGRDEKGGEGVLTYSFGLRR